MWRLRWVFLGLRSRSGGVVMSPTVRLGWWTAVRGLIARRGAPLPGSSSVFAGCGAAHGAGRCICRRVRGVPAATVWRILKRNDLNRLAWIDRPTGRVIRRYERSSPGELVHLDVKKVGKIPPGGGWRAHGRGSAEARRSKRRGPVGYTYLHVAIDDCSRVAYVEAHDNETAETLVGFWRNAQDWFWSNNMAVDEVLTDNGPNFGACAFAEVLAERAIVHRRTRPYRPQTNGKAERFNRTLTDEFLYNHRFRSENERRIRLKRWTHHYNCHRHHTAIGGPPASRANNLTRTDS